MCMPGTLVAMGLKGPRTSAGASGLGSQVSIWLGPPTQKQHDTVDVLVPASPAAFCGEEAGQRQAESGQRAGVQEIAARQAIAERTRGPVRVQSQHEASRRVS